MLHYLQPEIILSYISQHTGGRQILRVTDKLTKSALCPCKPLRGKYMKDHPALHDPKTQT